MTFVTYDDEMYDEETDTVFLLEFEAPEEFVRNWLGGDMTIEEFEDMYTWDNTFFLYNDATSAGACKITRRGFTFDLESGFSYECEETIVDINSAASALYDGGWRSSDKLQMMREYALTKNEVEKICALLSEFENEDKERDTGEEQN